MQNSAVISLQDVHLSYGKQSVLEGLSLQVFKGEVFGILGGIGSGKTRILRLIAGLESPQSGQIALSASLEAQKIGYVVQNDLLVPWLTVEENLRLCSGRDIVSDPLLTEVDLHPMLEKKPRQLSGGMRKKVNFTRAFINKSKLVLMDEPFGALDPSQKRELQELVLRLLTKSGATGVMVTHDIQEALLVCHKVAFLSSRARRLIKTLDNPYQGRTDTAALLGDSGYRDLIQTALDFYDQERT